MGYRTFVDLAVIEFDTTKKNKHASAKEALEAIIKETDPCSLCFEDETSVSFEDNNGHTLEEIVELTARDPGLLLEADIDGSSEDSSDQRNVRIRGGESEEHTAKMKYAVFNRLVTEDEKQAHAKAEKACSGRKDLKRVAMRIAEDYGCPSVAEDLCKVMADTAKEYLLEMNP